MTTEQRQAMIIAAGVSHANTLGLEVITAQYVAQVCKFKTSVSTVKRYYPTKTDLWAAIVNHPEANETLKGQAKIVGIL